MVIVFKSGRKEIGEIGLLSAMVSFSVLMGGLVALFTSPDNVIVWMSTLNEVFLPKSRWYESLLIPWVKLFFFVPALLSFLYAWRRVIGGFLLAIREICKQNARFTKHLVRKKLSAEYQAFPNASPDSAFRQLVGAKADEKLLAHASELGVIDNYEISECIWPDFARLPLHARAIIDVSQGEAELQKLEIEARRGLDEAVKHGALTFLVSPVQPSVLSAVTDIINAKSTLSSITLLDRTLTGPQTVLAARDELSRVNQAGDERAVVFVAPLSAFCTAEVKSDKDTIPHNFSPILNLINECQDVLVLEGGSNTPLEKSSLYYYNNSTAEECVAQLGLRLLEICNVIPVDDYDEYKALLKGGSMSNGLSLKPGDAIVTWPPLTEYYAGKSTSTGYFAKNSLAIGSSSKSRIMLFASQSVVEDPNTPSAKLAWAFMRCLNVRLLAMNVRLRKSIFGGSSWFVGKKIVKNYNHLFRNMII